MTAKEPQAMNAYELKQAIRKSRQAESAEHHAAAAASLFELARKSIEHIPPGQPILVGHHSERRHRRDLERHDRLMRRAIEADKRAKEMRGRAATQTNAISSDDPDAPDKLREKIEALEALQARMVAANKLVRKKDRGGLAAAGYTERQIEALFTPDFCGRIGFANYQLTNNGANIRRLKDRLAHLERAATEAPQPDIEGDGWTITEDKGDNRLGIVFRTIPAPDMRAKLKAHGFRWSPTRGAWVRQLNNAARWAAFAALGIEGNPIARAAPASDPVARQHDTAAP
jgi:uncharacterized protein DUF3560